MKHGEQLIMHNKFTEVLGKYTHHHNWDKHLRPNLSEEFIHYLNFFGVEVITRWRLRSSLTTTGIRGNVAETEGRCEQPRGYTCDGETDKYNEDKYVGDAFVFDKDAIFDTSANSCVVVDAE
jgi:hypothetical protein